MHKDKEKNYVKFVDFTEQTPKIQIDRVIISDLYRKAFFDKNTKDISIYSRNTTTWD